MNKSCSKCKVVKELSAFPPNKRVKSGLGSWCRTCVSEYNKGPRNRENARLTSRKFRDRHRPPETQARSDELKAVALGLSDSISCLACRTIKPLSEFFKHSLGMCRKCTLKAQGERAKAKSKNRIKIAGDECKDRKRKCRSIINNLLSMGKIEKQPCIVCGADKVHAHHPDYNEPLVIEWLCPQHHNDKHWS